MSGNDFPRDSTSLGFAFSFHNTVHLLATGFEVEKKGNNETALDVDQFSFTFLFRMELRDKFVR